MPGWSCGKHSNSRVRGPCTGKSLSEALIFPSTYPQYEDRLFIELQVQYMKILSSNLGRTCCVQTLFLTLRTIFVHSMFSPCPEKKKSFWQRFTCAGYKGQSFIHRCVIMVIHLEVPCQGIIFTWMTQPTPLLNTVVKKRRWKMLNLKQDIGRKTN